MRPGGFARLSPLALVWAGLFLATCLTASAEVASPDHHGCAALTAEQVSLAKTACQAPGSGVASVDPAAVLRPLPEWRFFPPDLITPCASAALWGERFSRAPPIRL